MTQYFDPEPQSRSRTRTVELALRDMSVELTTDRGVFSADRVDPGTKILLQDAPLPGEPQALLDLGCGYGPVAVVLARRAPHATVWAVDVNERARALTAANAVRAGVENVVVGAPSDVPDDLRFDALYSNPPIRIGAKPLHALLEEWVPRADEAFLVVHKHLGSDSLARWMDGLGWQVSRLESRLGYRLLRVSAGGARVP